MIFEEQGLFIAGIQGDGLHPVSVLVREVVGGGDMFLRHPVGAGGDALGSLAVRSGGPVVLIVVVNALDLKHGAGDNRPGVSVRFGEGQQGLLLIHQPKFSGFSGGQLYMVLRLVQNIVREGSRLHDGVHAGLQVLHEDLAAVRRGAVDRVAGVLNGGDLKGNAIQGSAVRTGLD